MQDQILSSDLKHKFKIDQLKNFWKIKMKLKDRFKISAVVDLETGGFDPIKNANLR